MADTPVAKPAFCFGIKQHFTKIRTELPPSGAMKFNFIRDEKNHVAHRCTTLRVMQPTL
jgi:hypothetical protein